MLPIFSRKNHVLVNLYRDELDQLPAQVKEAINAYFQCIFCKRKLSNCDCNERNYLNLDQKMQNEIILLNSMQLKWVGKDDDYFGTYLVLDKHWEQIDIEVRRSQNTERDRKYHLQREFSASFRHNKSTINDVGEWLKGSYPNRSFALKRVAVAWKEQPSKSAAHERLRFIYERAFKKKEKPQHGLLKWIAWNWLCEAGGKIRNDGYGRSTQFQNGSCVYEQQLLFTQNSVGRSIDQFYADCPSSSGSGKWQGGKFYADGPSSRAYVRSGKWPNNKYFQREPGDKQIISDVFGYGISVECGVTRAESLVLPLVHEVCEMTVWIPFFNEVTNRDKESVSEVTAFCIRLKKSAQKGWADIVV